MFQFTGFPSSLPFSACQITDLFARYALASLATAPHYVSQPACHTHVCQPVASHRLTQFGSIDDYVYLNKYLYLDNAYFLMQFSMYYSVQSTENRIAD